MKTFLPTLLVLLALEAGLFDSAKAADTATRPNIVVILADDVRWDDLGCTGHPFSQTPNIDRIAREGMTFRNAFATTPLCSPSRASFLTGLYAHSHGIVDNTERSAASHKLSTFPQALQRAGYETAFVGKWHMGNDDSRRPGFDHWACLKGQGTTFDAQMNVNGESVKSRGYVTDALTEQALAFLKHPRTKPFLLYFSHKAVHPETVQRADGSLSDPSASNFIPAERHKDLYAGVKISRRPSALKRPEGKPALLREVPGLPPLGPGTGTSDESILGRLRMLAAVDESTGEVFRTLESLGRLDDTLIVFASDHGYFYGEHGLSVERRLAYEETIRIPLLLRLPARIKTGSVREAFVQSIDLAPTLLELAGEAILPGLQGRSLVPLFEQDSPSWRASILVEHFSDKVFPRMAGLGYQSVRTAQWKYIHYTELKDADELYDLVNDPYEMTNRIADPYAAKALSEMQVRLYEQIKAP